MKILNWDSGPRFQRDICNQWKIETNVFSSLINLFLEYQVLDFWESSIQPYSFLWILPTCLHDLPFPQLTVIDALSRAQGQQNCWQQEQQNLGRSHVVSLPLLMLQETQTHSWAKSKRMISLFKTMDSYPRPTNIWFSICVSVNLLGSRYGQALHWNTIN